MSLSIKTGVRVFGLRPEILLAVVVAEGIWREFGVDLVLTAGIDGAHVEGSFHYSGNAVDLRTNNLPTDQTGLVLGKLSDRLGADYFAQIESDHIHVQFKPKATYTGGTPANV